MDTTEPTTAAFSLTRLCGCNYRQPITGKGKSIIVADPQHPEKRYRIDAAKFFAGEMQFRDSWCIELWTEATARRMQEEAGWQD